MAVRCVYSFVVLVVFVFFFPIFQMKFDSSFYPLGAVRIPLQYDEVSPPLSLRTCVHGRVPFFISIKKIQQCVSFVLQRLLQYSWLLLLFLLARWPAIIRKHPNRTFFLCIALPSSTRNPIYILQYILSLVIYLDSQRELVLPISSNTQAIFVNGKKQELKNQSNGNLILFQIRGKSICYIDRQIQLLCHPIDTSTNGL